MFNITRTIDPSDVRWRVTGIDGHVPLLDGGEAAYVNLDNAASTPPLQEVVQTIAGFLPYYSSVHRGSGFKSRLSTASYEHAHDIIARFVGADTVTNTVIFGKNTTEAINKLAYRFPLSSDDVVITTQLEHHSNDLPWRQRAKLVHVGATSEGRLDEEDFDRKLEYYGNRVALVTVGGASNVTGFVQPIHRLARKAHSVGAKILVDAAQLAPHRRIDMKPDSDPEHLDFVALSAHKMYAPFGTGALIGPKQTFLASGPECRGGGTVEIVTLDDVEWAGLPDREEAGSPNVVGAVALAAAAQTLMSIGMENIAAHEQKLTAYALEKLAGIPSITIHGEADPDRATDRVGVIPFNLNHVPHALVAAILGYEWGIGVRNGCFCAQPYIAHLLQMSEAERNDLRTMSLAGEKSHLPGMVRVSFGIYNCFADIDRLIEALKKISARDYRGTYQVDSKTGDYFPQDYKDPLDKYFSLSKNGGWKQHDGSRIAPLQQRTTEKFGPQPLQAVKENADEGSIGGLRL